MKRILLFSVIIFSFAYKGQAQEVTGMPANYAGVLAGIEWNTISGLTGVEYERILFGRENVTIGIKGTYTFSYRTGNMQLLNRPCCTVASIGTGLATVDYFTSQNDYPSGFFFHAGAGVGMKTYSSEHSRDLIQVRPAVEFGGGWLFPLGRRMALKWTNTVTFPSRDAGITITRVALGF
jgi:hypothetical protein